MNNAHNPPTHILFHVKQTSLVDEDTGYRKGLWTRIGAGWRLPSGRINLVQDYLPNCEGTLQVVPVEALAGDED